MVGKLFAGVLGLAAAIVLFINSGGAAADTSSKSPQALENRIPSEDEFLRLRGARIAAAKERAAEKVALEVKYAKEDFEEVVERRLTSLNKRLRAFEKPSNLKNFADEVLNGGFMGLSSAMDALSAEKMSDRISNSARAHLGSGEIDGLIDDFSKGVESDFQDIGNALHDQLNALLEKYNIDIDVNALVAAAMATPEELAGQNSDGARVMVGQDASVFVGTMILRRCFKTV